MTWTVPIATDSDGELIIVFPDAMIEELDWNIGDSVIWKQLDDGSWSLTKREDSDS